MTLSIVFTTPTFEQIESLVDEMSYDKWVGPIEDGEPARLKWLTKEKARIVQRQESGENSTIILKGSTVIGIAYNKPCVGKQAIVANIKDSAGYYKMGNFYITKAFRGQGIGKLALAKYISSKHGKVCYFAELENDISNKVATTSGLSLTHRTLVPQSDGKPVIISKSSTTRIRCPHNAYNVYFFKVPSEDQLLIKSSNIR